MPPGGPSSLGYALLLVALAGPGGAIADPLPLPEGGWVTAVAVVESGRILADAPPRLDLTPPGPPGRRRRRPTKNAVWTLRATLHAVRPTTASLRVGCSPRCEVRLGGQLVATVDKPYRAFPDDTEATVALPAGPTGVEVRIRRRRSGRTRPELLLRLVGPAGGAPEGVGLSVPGLTDAELLARTLPVHWEVTPEGSDLRVRAVLGPRGAPGPSVDAVLEGGSPASTRGERRVLERTTRTAVTTRLSLRVGRRTVREVVVRHTPDADWLRRIAEGHSALRAAPADGRLAEARDTLAYGVERLTRAAARGERPSGDLTRLAAAVGRQAAALRRGEDPLNDERGVIQRAYRSALDGRLQPYALYVPARRGPAGRLPLVVALHPSGHTPLRTLRSALGWVPVDGRRARETPRRAIVVAPYGYGGTGSRYFSKVDVLEVMDRVQRRYRTDPRRVLLGGGSLGGLGAWHLGLRVPDRFSVLMPMAGYGSVSLYDDVKGIRRLPFEDFLLARRDSLEFVENAGGQTRVCIHGARDDPRRARIMVDRYRHFGWRHVYEELEGRGHNVWDTGFSDGRAVSLARRHRRAVRPARVRFVSGSYRHRTADWVRIDQFQDHGRLGHVRAQDHGGRVAVQTENIRRLTLDLGAAPRDLRVDGVALGEASGSVHLARGVRWERVARPEPPAGEKRPGLAGPLDDIRYEPHLVVYGTQDPSQTETNRLRAEDIARYRWASADIAIPVLADTALDPGQMRTHHLILVGNPRSNRVLAGMADQLPVQWSSDAVTIGGSRFVGPGVGVSFIYPNPKAPDRYVVVHGGVGRRGTWLSAWLPRWLPDFVVYDEGIAVQRGGRLLDRRRPLAGGNFDRQWQLRPPVAAPTLRRVP